MITEFVPFLSFFAFSSKLKLNINFLQTKIKRIVFVQKKKITNFLIKT